MKPETVYIDLETVEVEAAAEGLELTTGDQTIVLNGTVDAFEMLALRASLMGGHR